MSNQEFVKGMEKSASDFQAARAIFSTAIRFSRTADKEAIEYALGELEAVKKNDTALYLAVELTIKHCNDRLEVLAIKAD